MKSSYNNNINYCDLISGITFMQNPKTIVEFGILEGASLKTFIDNTSNSCNIIAYDIFDEFNGNGSNKDELNKTFSKYSNVSISYSDFYKQYKNIEDNSVDILHIDIANNGDVIEFALENYMKKLSKNGILLFEGGSQQRDQVEWMDKYNKPKIHHVLEKYKEKYSIITIGEVPSLTIVKSN